MVSLSGIRHYPLVAVLKICQCVLDKQDPVIFFGLCKSQSNKFMVPLLGIEKDEFKYQYSNQRDNCKFGHFSLLYHKFQKITKKDFNYSS